MTDSKMELHWKQAPHQKPTQESWNVHFAAILTTRNAEEKKCLNLLWNTQQKPWNAPTNQLHLAFLAEKKCTNVKRYKWGCDSLFFCPTCWLCSWSWRVALPGPVSVCSLVWCTQAEMSSSFPSYSDQREAMSSRVWSRLTASVSVAEMLETVNILSH